MKCDQRRSSLLGAGAALFAVACVFVTGCTTDSTAEDGLDRGQTADADGHSSVNVGTDAASDGNAGGLDGAGSDGEASNDADSAPLPQCATADDCPNQNPCLIGTCTAKGTCAWLPKADANLCDDGNACTTADSCASGQCAGKGQLTCDDENPCTADKCNPYAGCLFLPAAASSACDDGDACTQGDSCQQGQCEAGVNTCQCKTTSDCIKFEDGDQCNGTLYCDKTAGAPYTCKVNPASVVSCPSVNNSACQKNTCLPATGQCKLFLAPENTPCDDGESCTTGDFCDSGLCQGGANTCYCKKDSDCKTFEDGNLCNGSLFCNKATAQCQVNPVTVVNCQTVDDTQCLRNTCNPKEGKCYLLPLKDGKVCDDGNPCTPNEACDKGECQSAINTCECQKDADCQAKDDGNLCNGTLYCDVQAKKCRTNPATVVGCNTDDDPACLADTCDPKTGKCKEIGLPKDGTACDDGNLCTALSLCSGGQCMGQANVCECQKDSDCAAKEDGSLCNGTLFCNPKSSKCEVNPATVVECASAFDENCLTNQCDPKTGGCGMQPAHQGNQCDDGSVCSAGGWCTLGNCEVTLKQACECVQDSDCAKLEDGDLCNGTLYCDKTGGGSSGTGGAGGKPSCKLNPATVISCPTVDNTACSKAICQAKSGQCTQTPVSGPCEDGKVCTEKDGCLSGNCLGLAKVCSDGIACTTDACQKPFGCVSLPGPASSCDDQNPCTQDSCDPKSGCTASANGAACDDGNTCTTKDVCKGGACTGGLNSCNDDNPCTDDGCGGGKCQYSNNTADCSDGNSCTAADKCALGNCGAGKPKICDDSDLCTVDSCSAPSGQCLHSAGGSETCSDANPCTDDLCHPVQGCGHTNNKAACSDGNPCTSGDGCLGGSCTSTGNVQCDDGNPCTDDSCNPKVGCAFVANTAACQDNDVCTLLLACKGGMCVPTKVQDCGDGNLCTDDSCDPKLGCSFVNNTKACDATTCTGGSVCKAGNCVTGAVVKLSTGTVALGNNVHLRGIAAFTNGDLAVVGEYSNSEGGAARIGADGKAIWKWDTVTAGGNLTAVLAMPDGSMVGFGDKLNGTGSSVRRFGVDGKILSDVTIDQIGPWVAVAPHPIGGYWALSTTWTGLTHLGRLSASFEAISLTKLPTGRTAWGIANFSDGRALVVGSATVSTTYLTSGWVGIYGNNGQLESELLLAHPTTHRQLVAVTARKGGGYVAVGYSGVTYTGVTQAWRVGLDASGKVLWQYLTNTPYIQTYLAVTALTDGGVVIAGMAVGVAGSADGQLVRLDPFGNEVWQRTYGGSGTEHLNAVTERADGGIAAAGDSLAKPWFIRTDAWGNASCLDTGNCLNVDVDGCDDNDPCTIDTCIAASGCKHVAAVQGALCSATKACDGKGNCSVSVGP